MSARRWLIAAAVLPAALLLGGCYVDEDGDGIDDNTGQPIPTAQGPAADGGCDPGGMPSLQPEHCQTGDQAGEQTAPAPTPSRYKPPSQNPCRGASTSDNATASRGEMTHAARHEAGHAAAAEDLGWSLRSVEIFADGSGCTQINWWDWKDPQQRLIVLYAGAAAAGSVVGADYDYTAAEDILAGFPEGEQAGVEDAALAEAERIVAKRAAQIDRSAADLLEDGELS